VECEKCKKCLSAETPPEELSDVVKALWWDAKDDWSRAHETAQDVNNADGAWVHAYLHRKEGDLGNAGYWYSRAGKPRSDDSLEEEWEAIARELLTK